MVVLRAILLGLLRPERQVDAATMVAHMHVVVWGGQPVEQFVRREQCSPSTRASELATQLWTEGRLVSLDGGEHLSERGWVLAVVVAFIAPAA